MIEPSGELTQTPTDSPALKPIAPKKNTSPGWPACGSTRPFLLGGSTGRTSGGPLIGLEGGRVAVGNGTAVGVAGGDPSAGGGAFGASGAVSSGGAKRQIGRA